MEITRAQLSSIFVNARAADIDRFLKPINDVCKIFKIDTPKRVAHFLAQIGHESGELRHVKEIWGPTAAQRRYEGRVDLGNIVPGDGKKFMGRGLIQTTGRRNYEFTSLKIYGDKRLLDNPELLEQPYEAAYSAGLYWDSRRLNPIADQVDGKWTRIFKGKTYNPVEWITLRVNGGQNGIDDRKRIYGRAKTVFRIP